MTVRKTLSLKDERWFDVTTYGAKCDNTTNDATAIQAALTAAGAAGGGTVFIPGKSVVNSTLTVPSNVKIQGASREGSWLRRTTNNILLDFSGTASGTANHNKIQTLQDITLTGNGTSTGALMRAYYVDNLSVLNVRFTSVADKAVDAVELWDTTFIATAFENCNGADGTKPAVHIRNASAPTGFGSSTDNSNMIYFMNCRFEAFKDGAAWIERGDASNTNNPNGIHFIACKFENHTVRGKFVYFDDATMLCSVQDSDFFVGAFDAGYSTPVNALVCNAVSSATLRGLRFVTSEAAGTMNTGINVYSGEGPVLIQNIEQRGANAPVGSLIYFAGGAGKFQYSNIKQQTGTMFGGTIPKNPTPPTGGSTGQVLSKVSGTDYDFTWTTLTGINGVVQSTAPSSPPSNYLWVDTSEPGVLEIGDYSTTTPAVPTTGAKIFARSRAGRRTLAQIGPSGIDYSMQPNLWGNAVALMRPNGNATTLSVIGVTATAIGTATTANVASTSDLASVRRLSYISSATAGTSGGVRGSANLWWRGNAAGRGGFFFVMRFGLATITATRRWFVGMQNAGAPANADPSAIINMIGVGQDVGDTTIQFMHNDGTGVATKNAGSSTLSSIAANEVWEVRIFCAPNGSTVSMSVERVMGTPALSEYTATTDLPSSTTFMAPILWANNGTTASAIDPHLVGLYIESDN